MKKTLLAGAVTLSLGVAPNASALTVEMTSMNFGSVSAVLGTLSSMHDGSDYGSMSGLFFGQPWDAWGLEYYDEVGVQQQFAGTSPQGAFSYNFTLGQGQVAWGMAFCWSCSVDLPVLNIMDCDENGDGGIEVGEQCTGIGTPMQTGPFPGQAPSFNGDVTSVVPVPAAVWLFGSGLLGLFSFRRFKCQTSNIKI